MKRRGGIVVATTSGGEGGERPDSRSAPAPIMSSAMTASVSIVDEATDGAGAHVVYDGVGKDTFDDGLARCARAG